MIKIERIKPGTKAVFMRGGVEHPIFLGQLLSSGEFESLQITSGGITISIDETDVQELTAPEAASTKPTEAPVTTSTKPTEVNTKSTEVSTKPTEVSTNPTEVSTKPAIVPATPNIIQPKKSGK